MTRVNSTTDYSYICFTRTIIFASTANGLQFAKIHAILHLHVTFVISAVYSCSILFSTHIILADGPFDSVPSLLTSVAYPAHFRKLCQPRRREGKLERKERQIVVTITLGGSKPGPGGVGPVDE